MAGLLNKSRHSNSLMGTPMCVMLDRERWFQLCQQAVIEEDPTPSWVATTDWNVTFRQLAVAVGGAMPSLPEQR